MLDYLGRYTHRVAIANSRLVGLAEGRVSFRWKDYRHHDKQKVMTPWRRRVHPPLPAPRPARRLPSHPPLRLSRQRSTRRQARRLPPSAGGPRAGAACPCRRLPRALPAAHRPLTRPLSGLRRPHDRNRRHPPCQHFRRCGSLEHLMIPMPNPVRAQCPGSAPALDAATPLALPATGDRWYPANQPSEPPRPPAPVDQSTSQRRHQHPDRGSLARRLEPALPLRPEHRQHSIPIGRDLDPRLRSIRLLCNPALLQRSIHRTHDAGSRRTLNHSDLISLGVPR